MPSTPAAGTAAIGQSADPTSLATGHAAAVPSLDFGGRAVAIAGDSNAAVHAVSVAAQAHARPELRSIDVEAPAFDRIAYEHDPVGYCAEAVPARCFQAAQPHRDVPVLRCASANYTRIDQDQSCALRVRAPAGAPVSLTSLDLGTFQNGLTAITVRADADGLAEATFSAGPGTINDVHILAGCPLASGQVRFVVNVTPSALAQVRSR